MSSLPSSGAISIGAFNTAMGSAPGYSPTKNTSLNSADVRAVADKPTGAISLADLRGKPVGRPASPVSFISAIPAEVSMSTASGVVGIFMEILDTGYLQIRGIDSGGTPIWTAQTNWLKSVNDELTALMRQFKLSVTRTAWNGNGSASVSIATEDWGTRGNLKISIDKTGVLLPDATFSITLTDRFVPENTVTFYLRMYLT